LLSSTEPWPISTLEPRERVTERTSDLVGTPVPVRPVRRGSASVVCQSVVARSSWPVTDAHWPRSRRCERPPTRRYGTSQLKVFEPERRLTVRAKAIPERHWVGACSSKAGDDSDSRCSSPLRRSSR